VKRNGTPTELGTEKIGLLLRQYAMPSIIAMTAASLYNITDSIFIGHGVDALALAGLAICFPIMNLAAAFGSLAGVGASTLLSIRMGQKDYSSANLILGNLLILNLMIGIAFSAIALLFLDAILLFFGASEITLPYARQYMSVLLIGNVITHIYYGINSLLRSLGYPTQSMYATVSAVAINVVLNALFIFGFKWGIIGSSAATVSAQTLVLAWQIYFFRKRISMIQFSRKIFKFDTSIIKNILSIGSASFFVNAAACLVVIVINQRMIKYGGDLAVGAYGIVNRIGFLFFMIVVGLNAGMQPIAGYNFGAKKYDRLLEVLKKTIFWASAVVCVGTLIIQCFPYTIAAVFTHDQELITQSVKGLRILFAVCPVIGFQMVVSNFFQSVGMAGKAIFMSLSRQIVFLLPLLLILPHHFGIDGIWFAFPISDFIASITAAIMLYLFLKQVKKNNI
jgi:putative MATE family efflux protein